MLMIDIQINVFTLEFKSDYFFRYIPNDDQFP